ncbi:hypothetical protein L1887_57253 [Cichorium endivia]|nr:hypothetical protein L1887_57253 [Cichorium endivia]
MKVERKAEADWSEAKLGRCRAGSAPSQIQPHPESTAIAVLMRYSGTRTLRQPGRSCSAIMRRARCHKQCCAYDWATKLAGALQRDPGLARLCAMRKGSRQAKGETLAAAALHTPDTLKEAERRVGKSPSIPSPDVLRLWDVRPDIDEEGFARSRVSSSFRSPPSQLAVSLAPQTYTSWLLNSSTGSSRPLADNTSSYVIAIPTQCSVEGKAY